MERKPHIYFLLFILIIGIMDLLEFSRIIGYELYRMYIRVILFMICTIALWFLPRKRITIKLKYQTDFYIWAIILSILLLGSLFVGGMINRFGRNPYILSPKGIAKNIVTEVFPVVASIWIRYYIILSVKKKYRIITAIGLTVLIAVSQFSIRQLIGGDTLEATVSFLASYVIPELAIQGVVTYFAVMAGTCVGMVYYLIITIPFYILNVIPDLEWLTALFIKTVLPIFSLMVLHEVYSTKNKKIIRKDKSSESSLSIMITSIIAVMIVWFAVGVFPIYPNVVLTGSMIPNIMPGDIVLVEKSTYLDVKKGDVLFFEKGEVHIVHRVIDIDQKKWLFQTKGDNNKSPDLDWVESGQVRGIVKGKIPYMGRIILWFRGA